MKLSQIKESLQATTIYEEGNEKELDHVFASDLMSDALALVEDGENTLFLTGLINVQVLRTAEMLDIHSIVFVRHKMPNEKIIETAKELHLNVYSTHMTMFEASGRLYEGGMRP